MRVSTLRLQGFRNIHKATLSCHPYCNIITGHNGAGKSALLEALYFLCHGRSFRTTLLNRIIRQTDQQFYLFAALEAQQGKICRLGIMRSRSGQHQQRWEGKNISSLIPVTRQLPVVALYPESFSLFTQGSSPRRALIDWGLFYQEPTFFQHWQNARQILRQRNAALKQQVPDRLLKLWDQQLVPIAEQIDTARTRYNVVLWQTLERLLGDFLATHHIECRYYRGWPEAMTLSECLVSHRLQDRTRGFTHYGIQRADLRMLARGKPAGDQLSRGQQKTLTCGLKLAQGLALRQATGQSCIYLMDDLYSELDTYHGELLWKTVKQLEAQCFFTGIHQRDFSQSCTRQAAYFRLEGGQVNML